MNLKGLVAISGRSGLYKLVGQNKTGYILEGLDEQKLKIVAGASNTKLASLEDITLYGQEEEIKLADVFVNIEKAKAKLPDIKADGKTLRNFFLEVAPNHNQEKVYASDMKKILSWYHIIKDLPLFTEQAQALPSQETLKLDGKPPSKHKTVSKAKLSNTAKAITRTSAPAKKTNTPVKRGA